jgi:uncharacterized protein YkwD
MSFRRSSASTFRRLTAVGLAAVGFAGVAASAAPSAHAANLGVLVSCPFMEQAYASRDVSTLTQYQRERTGWCTVNDARHHFGAPALRDQSQLQASSLGHAQRAVALRWWSTTDGLVSHVDPSQSGMTPSDAIAQRIAKAGFCRNGTPDTNENTFSSWGDGGGFPPTILGAVRWWLHDPPHRATLLSTEYKRVGFAAMPGSAFPQDTGSAQAGTFVADFGSCSGT